MYHTPMNTFESLDPTKITLWPSKMASPPFFKKKIFAPVIIFEKSHRPQILSKKVSPFFLKKSSPPVDGPGF